MIVVAAALPLIVGGAAISVDTYSMTLAKRQLQRNADSAALAGAYAIVQDLPPGTSVDHDLELNKKLTIHTKQIENAPTTGPFQGNVRAVRVTLTNVRPTPFFSFFSKTTPEIRAQATAAVVFTGRFCMISLEDSSAVGVTFQGNAMLDLGCGVATNSKATSAISTGGSSTIIASPIAAVGGIPTSTNYAGGTKLLPYSPKQPDPFAKLPLPQPPSNCSQPLNVGSNGNVTIPTSANGVYCYSNMDIKGAVTLPPGVHYIDGGSLNANANASITGHGVTIILTNSSNPAATGTVDINGGATLNLSAPKSGTYGGVLFYQDPRATLGNVVKINGNSASSIEGAFYFPKATLNFNGTMGMRTECLQLVARRLSFSGNSRVINQCPADGDARAFDASFVRLVG